MSWWYKFRYRLAKVIIHFIALKISADGTLEYCLNTAELYKEYMLENEDV